MRDPQARLEYTHKFVLRILFDNIPENHVLKTDQAKKWVDQDLLIAFRLISQKLIESPRLEFVTSPEEWCNAQLFDAAKLTLLLLEKANNIDSDLKDASAWNVIFDGCIPKFCDLTSFEPIQSKNWWAAGQFVRHFISPLWLAQERGFRACDIFRMSRDGASPEHVKKILGLRRFFSRCWPLVALSYKIKFRINSSQITNSDYKKFRKKLIASFNWMLDGVRPEGVRPTIWGNYTQNRDHYSSKALVSKRQQVLHWLNTLKPQWTLDLGCNNGEFSRLALEVGSKVIAVDSDHDSIQNIYKSFYGKSNIYPVLASLDDLHSGRGWSGKEHKGLVERLTGSADVVLMLALIHHLSIAAGVHLDLVANFAASCTRRWLIVELLEPHDPQVRLLCKQRRRKPEEFTIANQMQAFIQVGFKLIDIFPLPENYRHLALFEKI